MESKQWTVVKSHLMVKDSSITAQATEAKSFITTTDLHDLVISAINGRVSESQFAGLKAFAHNVAYDGFNPQVIIQILATKAKSGVSDDTTINFVLDGVEFKAKKGIDFATDVQMLITLFLVRGNNLFKIMKTVSKDAKTISALKIAAYALKSDDDSDAAARRRKEKVVLSSSDITLSRIVASFPHLTLAIAKHAGIVGKANLAAITAQMKLDTNKLEIPAIPHVLQHGLIPALLSRTEPDDERELRQFCYMFNLEQTMTLQHPAAKKMMMVEPISNQIENSMKFVTAAIQGPLMTDAVRVDIRRTLIDLDGVDVVKRWVQAGSNAWIKASTASNYSGLIMILPDSVSRIATEGPSTSG